MQPETEVRLIALVAELARITRELAGPHGRAGCSITTRLQLLEEAWDAEGSDHAEDVARALVREHYLRSHTGRSRQVAPAPVEPEDLPLPLRLPPTRPAGARMPARILHRQPHPPRLRCRACGAPLTPRERSDVYCWNCLPF
ncbi:MAG TPA: hypothetical protein VMU90_10810 [Solirubrobacteraceae bacterium]|nr:hypothetical protein [Solirubrobacteraceae bacterium]